MEEGTRWSVRLVSMRTCLRVQVSRPCRFLNIKISSRRRSTSTFHAFPFRLDSKEPHAHLGDLDSPGSLGHHDPLAPISPTRRLVDPPSRSWILITKSGGTIPQP